MFIRGFRAKRILNFYKKMKAFAEHAPDDPDNDPESSIELVREPDVPEVGASSVDRSDCTYVFRVPRPTYWCLRLHRRSESDHSVSNNFLNCTSNLQTKN